MVPSRPAAPGVAQLRKTLRSDHAAPAAPAFVDRIVRAVARVGPPFGNRRELREAA